jgi:heme-degrading monooxygenase HmoA
MYLVIFRNCKRADIDAVTYAADAERMEALARSQPGFHLFKNYTAEDGEVVANSEWASEAAAHAWGRDGEHAAIHRRGREEYYEEYTLVSCVDPQVRSFTRDAE